jgi:TIR domain
MSTTKLEVFISYARADASAFVDDLAAGLEVADIQPLVDLQSISAAQEWKPRISALIQQSDTVIFVITPASVKSEICRWEIQEAIARSKRLVPVQWLETNIADIPPELAKLNLIFK